MHTKPVALKRKISGKDFFVKIWPWKVDFHLQSAACAYGNLLGGWLLWNISENAVQEGLCVVSYFAHFFVDFVLDVFAIRRPENGNVRAHVMQQCQSERLIDAFSGGRASNKPDFVLQKVTSEKLSMNHSKVTKFECNLRNSSKFHRPPTQCSFLHRILDLLRLGWLLKVITINLE